MSDCEAEVTIAQQPQKERNVKQKIIAEILCRWWMCMPAWPPVNYNYASLLKAKSLREVSVDTWEDEEDVVGGFEKVYQLSEFPGVFRKNDGSAVDLRPSEGKPSYDELEKKTEDNLWTLLVLALTVQIRLLKNESPFNEEPLIERLERQLQYARMKRHIF